MTERLLNSRSINSNIRLCACRSFGSGNFCKCDGLFDRGRQFNGISMSSDMHVHDSGRFMEHVVVDSSHLHAATFKRRHDRSYLIFSKYQITHDHGTGTGLAEGDPSTERQCWLKFYTLDRDFQVAPRKTEFGRAIRLNLARASNCLLNRLPFPRFFIPALGENMQFEDEDQENHSCCNQSLLSDHARSPFLIP